MKFIEFTDKFHISLVIPVLETFIKYASRKAQ